MPRRKNWKKSHLVFFLRPRREAHFVALAGDVIFCPIAGACTCLHFFLVSSLTTLQINDRAIQESNCYIVHIGGRLF